MKTDLIVLKTRSLKNFNHYMENSEEMCLWLDRVSLFHDKFAEIKHLIKKYKIC